MTRLYVACKPECPDATCHACGSGRQVHELKAELASERAAKRATRREVLTECVRAAEYVHGDLFGGYHGKPVKLDAFKHGMDTVGNMLRAKLKDEESANPKGEAPP